MFEKMNLPTLQSVTSLQTNTDTKTFGLFILCYFFVNFVYWKTCCEKIINYSKKLIINAQLFCRLWFDCGIILWQYCHSRYPKIEIKLIPDKRLSLNSALVRTWCKLPWKLGQVPPPVNGIEEDKSKWKYDPGRDVDFLIFADFLCLIGFR